MGSLFIDGKEGKNLIKNPVAPSLPDIKVPFYLQFVPGQVLEVATSDKSMGAYNEIGFINSILALPHVTAGIKKRRGQVGNGDRYFPLMRGIVDVPAKGDPVLLCDIGGKKYYLGPLNTDNNPNWNNDNLFRPEGTPSKAKLSTPPTTGPAAKGQSNNFKKVLHNRMMKPEREELDDMKSVHENHGDLLLEGRHGNSLRIGSRSTNPYMIMSNGRYFQNKSEGITDGSLISITQKGSIRQHFGNYNKVISRDVENPGDTSKWVTEEKPGFLLASDDLEEAERTMAKLIGSINQSEDVSKLIYDYEKNQVLIQSDRITFNSTLDDIYLSSKKDIHIGTARHMTISTNKNLVIESDNTYLGDPKDREDVMEPMILGNELKLLLEELLAIVKDLNSLFYGSPIPLTDSKMVPVKGLIVPIEQKLQKILSKHHYIEPNR